eukprot:907127_1
MTLLFKHVRTLRPAIYSKFDRLRYTAKRCQSYVRQDRINLSTQSGTPKLFSGRLNFPPTPSSFSFDLKWAVGVLAFVGLSAVITDEPEGYIEEDRLSYSPTFFASCSLADQRDIAETLEYESHTSPHNFIKSKRFVDLLSSGIEYCLASGDPVVHDEKTLNSLLVSVINLANFDDCALHLFEKHPNLIELLVAQIKNALSTEIAVPQKLSDLLAPSGRSRMPFELSREPDSNLVLINSLIPKQSFYILESIKHIPFVHNELTRLGYFQSYIQNACLGMVRPGMRWENYINYRKDVQTKDGKQITNVYFSTNYGACFKLFVPVLPSIVYSTIRCFLFFKSQSTAASIASIALKTGIGCGIAASMFALLSRFGGDYARQRFCNAFQPKMFTEPKKEAFYYATLLSVLVGFPAYVCLQRYPFTVFPFICSFAYYDDLLISQMPFERKEYDLIMGI